MTHHPFRFGLQLRTASGRSEWVEAARAAEHLGFTVLQISDHLDEVLAPLVSLATAAEATSTIRVGTLVLNNDLRHPALLAREVAGLDLLSGGRFELGIGAGWAEAEYDAAGLRFDPAPVRIERLGESLGILNGLLAGEEVTHTGRHYEVRALRAHPLPVQQPHPPILVGGHGPRLLTLAARQADIVGFTGIGHSKAHGPNDPSGFTAEIMDERVALVREAAGERWPQLELHALVQAVIQTDDRRASAERLAHRLAPLTPQELLTSPFVLLGTVDEMVEDLQARRERFGFSYVSVRAEARDALAPVVSRLAGT